MAFSESDKVTLQEILECSPLTLKLHFDEMVVALTTEAENAVKADIVLWNASYRNDQVQIEPNLKNFGARINPAQNRAAIRKRIAIWLDFLLPSSGSGLVRG